EGANSKKIFDGKEKYLRQYLEFLGTSATVCWVERVHGNVLVVNGESKIGLIVFETELEKRRKTTLAT
ncbi:hypothetical protein PG984_016473, partial [Apiospora sp. TS-2023a]